MIIVSLSDIHLSTSRYDGSYTDLNKGLKTDLAVRILKEKQLDETWHTKTKYHTPLNDFLLYQDLALDKIKQCNPELVVLNGDTFDLNPSADLTFPSRDSHFNNRLIEQVLHFTSKLVDIPILFLQGNADTDSYDDISNSNYYFSILNENGVKLINKKRDWEFDFCPKGNNFAIKTKTCLIVGLNSLLTNSIESPASALNIEFLKKHLNDNELPLILYVHHPIFNVIPEEVVRELNLAYMKKQEWLNSIIEKHSLEKGIPVLLVTGHCHLDYDDSIGNIRRLCMIPTFAQRESKINLGLKVNVNNSELDIERLDI